KSMVYECAKILADISNLPRNATYRRIIPKCEEELNAVKELYEKIHDKSLHELLNPLTFCRTFLNWNPLSYQIALLNDTSKQIVVRWTRQSGKTTTFAAKSLFFCITKPNSQALITSPGLRQSMIVSDKIEEIINKMNAVARRAWIKKVQRQTITFHNGSRVKALPYSLHRLRGETCDLIFVDEASFIRDDEILFDSILKPMLATRWQRGAQIIVSSTPWGKNTMFYRFCKDPIVAKDWSQHHITWRDAVKEGLIPLEFIEAQRRSISTERFQREYEAEFVEDHDSYLTQDLIARCQDPELEYWSFDHFIKDKELYAGIDLGKKHDYSVIAVLEKDHFHEDYPLKLVHLKRFELDTPYASVIGYMKILSERWKIFHRICVDQSGVGEYIVEDMRNAGIENIEGVVLTMQKKEEVLGYLKQVMLESKLKLPYDEDLIIEMNIEKYELTKDGHIKFSHPEHCHDDRLWALALAVYASRGKESSGMIMPV
ncbi:MAG: terminase family protein, partial [Nitrososphaerales archaeon]|nr:terminase family protein [Nitrososphaerales archaeon]